MAENKIIYEDVEIQVEKEQPMILVFYNDGGQNIDDSSEMIFTYDVMNFGNIEAKNVNIVCQVLGPNDKIIKEEVFNIGNIASNSYEYQESYMKYTTYGSEFGICKLDSVDGDYINLYDRLNDLK